MPSAPPDALGYGATREQRKQREQFEQASEIEGRFDALQG